MRALAKISPVSLSIKSQTGRIYSLDCRVVDLNISYHALVPTASATGSYREERTWCCRSVHVVVFLNSN